LITMKSLHYITTPAIGENQNDDKIAK